MKKQMRGFISGFLAAGLLFAVPAVADSVEKSIDVLVDSVHVLVDGQEVEVPNYVHEGTTYLGLRAMANVLGFQVDWDEETSSAIITTQDDKKNLVVLSVNGEKITAADFEAMKANLQAYAEQYGYQLQPEALKSATKDQLITKAVILQKAEELGLGVTEEDRQAANTQLGILEMMYGGAQQLDQVFAQAGTSREAYQKGYLDSKVQSRLFEFLRANDPEYLAVSEGGSAYYEQHLEDYKTPNVRVKHILFPTVNQKTGQPLSEEAQKEAEAQAKEIYEQLKKGADFETLLQQYSNDPGMGEDGYIVNQETPFVQEFKDAALKLRAGEFSEPVKTDYGFHVIKAYETMEYTPYEAFFPGYQNQKWNDLDSQNIKKWTDAAEIVLDQEVLNRL